MAGIDKRIVKLVETLERIGIGASSSYVHRLIMHMIDEELSRHEERYEARSKAMLDEELPEVPSPSIEPDSEDLDDESELDDSPDEVTHLGKFTLGDQVWFLGDISGRIHRGTIKKLFPLTQNALMVMSDSHWGCAEIDHLYFDDDHLITQNENLNIIRESIYYPTPDYEALKPLIIRSAYWWMDTTDPELPCKRWGNLVGVLNYPQKVTALIAEERHSNEWGQTFVLHRVNPVHLTVKGH